MSGNNAFQTYLQTSSKEITRELNTIAGTWKSKSVSTFSEINELNKHFTKSWFGGKMIRGTLVKLGFEFVSDKQSIAIWKPAAAFEILHTALLIHDDIIDQSPTRRGNSALHIHKNAHYGMSQAICLGDIGIALAGKLIAESEFSEVHKNRALRYFYEMVNTTISGEMVDVGSAQKINRTEKQILRIHEMKTANYSIVGPLAVGAILAGAGDDYLKNLKRFGEPLGIAYQIQDDILGVFGDEITLGKSTTSDIEENKSTLLISYAYDHATPTQKKILENNYGKKNITKKTQEMIKKIFVQTGSLEYSQNKIISLTIQAKKYISTLSDNKSNQLLLTQFCDFLMYRHT